MSATAASQDRKRAGILAAALKLFGQYGYRRTSIDDIAREADIAKGTVYLSFSSKEELFRGLCETLIAQVQSAAEAARKSSGTIEERLFAILDAKFGFYFEIVFRSAHAAELIDSKNRLSTDLFTRAERKYRRLVRDVVAAGVKTSELNLKRLGLSSDDAAELMLAAAHGVEKAANAPAAYHRRLRELVRVMVAGFGGNAKSEALAAR